MSIEPPDQLGNDQGVEVEMEVVEGNEVRLEVGDGSVADQEDAQKRVQQQQRRDREQAREEAALYAQGLHDHAPGLLVRVLEL